MWSRSWALASHPEVLQLSRHFLGERCRVVDAIAVLAPPLPSVSGAEVAAQPHHSARMFGMTLPQPVRLTSTFSLATQFPIQV